MDHANFVHLHVHTQYSLLDGACLLEKLVDKAVRLKLPALAITDHGNMFGAIKFYNLCIKKGIKPILGCEFYLASDSRFNKGNKANKSQNYHLVLLAKDITGYKNLIRLVSLAHLEGFYYKPRIDKDLLNEYNQGLLASSACLKGEIPSLILSGDLPGAYKAADEYLHIFGEGNFYLEIMKNGLQEQDRVNSHLIKISKDLGIPLLATNDIHYLDKDQAFAHQALLALQTQTTLSDPNRFRFKSESFYFKSPQEMKEAFSQTPEAIQNTIKVMQKCNLTLDFSKVHLPNFPLPDDQNDEDFLKDLCCQNFENKYSKQDSEAKKRLEHELTIINQTGFSSYFLIIWDLIKFAKENNIPVGPGRGSAAGSIVSYLLNITDIDPLAYDLLFERFLNPARISMPDIDIDFCYEKRSEILEYVSRRYGKENVAQIITFGTMLARAVIRDVGRVMDFTYSEVDKIAKMIPASVGHTVTLKEALSLNPDLEKIYKSDNRIKKLIDVAMQLEGVSRHASTHAAGVVISDKPLLERIPLSRGSEGEVVTGYDMDSLEKTGMLKMDFLGLKTLTVIDETIKIIKRTQRKDIDMANIPVSDKKTFSLLSEAETIGVFQLESRGMREILEKMKPSNFEDIVAVLALYRPGPLGSGMVDDFIERKQGTKTVHYSHPKLESILKKTYGIIVYQEQIMQIVSELAGFDMARADTLRKAIGKKIPEIIQEQKQLFLEGCKKNNISSKVANQIFDLIDYFSGYGFNKSHSTAYALISYRTAYLKAHFGVEFMAALLTSERNNTDKVVEYINEANRMKIKVLPPDINTSYANFTVTNDNNIRFGLIAIKNVGGAALESIILQRKEKKFKDIFDFCDRVDSRAVNKKVIESLIKSGAMDSLGLKRAQMMLLLDKLLARQTRKKKDASQLTLFSEEEEQEKIPEVSEWPLMQILSFEKTLLGVYLSGHPLYCYSETIKFLKREKISSLTDNLRTREVMVCGVIEKVKIVTTRRRNERMAIIRVEDETASVEVFVFPRLFAQTQTFLAKKKIIILRGNLDIKDRAPKILASDIFPIEQLQQKIKEVNIKVNRKNVPLGELKNIVVKNQGDKPVFFSFQDERIGHTKVKVGDKFCISLDPSALGKISALVGEANLSLTL
jgi:DNA polymerase III subunit alpha